MRIVAFALVALMTPGCMNVEWTGWERGPDDCRGMPAHVWPEASPDAVGLDADALETLARQVETGALPRLHSLLVVRDGRLVFERYFSGADAMWGRPLGVVVFSPDTLHDQRSVTKSVVGALVGIAHGQGHLPDLDTPLAANGGPTLRHALTMTAGLPWDELSHPYWDPRNDETAMWRSDDPVAYVLGRERVAAPGARFAYNGGLPTVLAHEVEAATGEPLDAFAGRHLWCPLGVRSVEWLRHGSGTFVAASGLRLRPRDMARLGWMMLDEGRFQDRQVVPAAYARASLSPQTATGGSLADRYGYLWWLDGFGEGEAAVRLPVAIGNGGQRIVVHRAARLVVVVTAGAYDRVDQGVAPRRAVEAVLAAILR